MVLTLQILCQFIFFSSLLPTTHSATPYAITTVGVIQGTNDTSPDGLPYFAFRGIPYAEPPVQNLRWQPPVAAPEFDAIYQATEFKPACPQKAKKGRETSEDCLYLDVYVPHNASSHFVHNATQAWQMWEDWKSRNESESGTSSPDPDSSYLPVLVWIHGGAYHSGGSEDNAAWKVATEQGVVVVVMQYRLGTLGFLSTGTSDLPGNYGLWDQRLALMWVKDNIQAFGGDVSVVTLAGESAGASSVSQHTLSYRSAGLFHRVVLISGSAEVSWCFNHNPRDTFDRFSMDAGCGDNMTSVSSRLQCLMTLSADVIYNTSVVTEAGNFVTFKPTVDGDFFPDTVQNLLQDDDYLNSTGFYDYDVLAGTLNNEGAVAFDLLTTLIPSLATTGQVPYVAIDGALLDIFLMQQLGLGYGPDIFDVVNNEYFYPRDPFEFSVPLRTLLDMYTDGSFFAPVLKTVRHHMHFRSGLGSTRSSSRTNKSPAGLSQSSGKSYMYFFDWNPSLTEGMIIEGMPHGLDVDYLWGLTNDSLWLYDEILLGGSIQPREHVVSRMYGDMIGAFVRTGDPNSGLPDSLNGKWLPYDVSNETFLRFSMTPSIDHHHNADRASLWIDLLPRLHSRWLEQSANDSQGTSQGPTAESTEDQKLTYFDLSESQANALLISLLVLCVVLFVFSVCLIVMFVRGQRQKNSNQYEMSKVDGGHERSGKNN